jgi:nucleoside-diphosphate-sugar epimerase
MKNVLITGGAGFIASSLIEGMLNSDKYNVVALDNFLTGNRHHLFEHENYKFIECDINNQHEFYNALLNLKFDYVFHYAAMVGVKRTVENPKKVLDDVYGLQNVFEFSKENGVKRIFFSSSSEVYGEPVHLPQNEHITPLNSRLPYAVVKNLGECFCRAYKTAFNVDYTIFRFFNTFGPKQSDDFVVSKFINNAIKNEDITIYGDGNQTRTFCYIDDNVEFTLKTINENLFINDIANVGDDKIITIKELALLIIKITGSKSKIVHVPSLKEGDMSRRQPDNSRMKSVLNRPLLSIEEGLVKLVSTFNN